MTQAWRPSRSRLITRTQGNPFFLEEKRAHAGRNRGLGLESAAPIVSRNRSRPCRSQPPCRRCWPRASIGGRQRQSAGGLRPPSPTSARPICWRAAWKTHTDAPQQAPRPLAQPQYKQRGQQARPWLLGESTACQASPEGASPLPATTARPSPWPRELGMRPLQAHCHRGLGMLYARVGQRQQARAALARHH